MSFEFNKSKYEKMIEKKTGTNTKPKIIFYLSLLQILEIQKHQQYLIV